jgi:hypothetical protein
MCWNHTCARPPLASHNHNLAPSPAISANNNNNNKPPPQQAKSVNLWRPAAAWVL